MKSRLVIILLFAIATSCCNSKPVESQSYNTSIQKEVVHDTLYLPTKVNDSLFFEVQKLNKTIKLLQSKNDSLIKVHDTLATRLLRANLMIENARFYLKITIKNPSQTKFLKGWMRRALEVN